MRIISGLFKGKKFLEPKDKKTRPLKDLTKESIFNIITHSKNIKINFEKSNILDLFSGVGSFGIECLSRNAKNVVFVENYQGVISILKKNLDNLKSINNYEIIEKDIYQSNMFAEFDKKFNIIFLDPPYKDNNLDKLLTRIKNNKILEDDGVLVLHRHKDQKDTIPENYEIIENKRYGISRILFLHDLS